MSARGFDLEGLAAIVTGGWLRAQIAGRTPSGRVSEPEDVARAIGALLVGSRQVTGEIVICDGGGKLARG